MTSQLSNVVVVTTAVDVKSEYSQWYYDNRDYRIAIFYSGDDINTELELEGVSDYFSLSWQYDSFDNLKFFFDNYSQFDYYLYIAPRVKLPTYSLHELIKQSRKVSADVTTPICRYFKSETICTNGACRTMRREVVSECTPYEDIACLSNNAMHALKECTSLKQILANTDLTFMQTKHVAVDVKI